MINFLVPEMKTVLASLMDGHVTYSLGAKVWIPKNVEPAKVTKLDCSGFVKYLAYRVSKPLTNLPAGSSLQEDWCKKRFGRKGITYATEASKADGKVRIAFRDRTPAEIRHVWLIVNGWTIECTKKGAANGPFSFRWDQRTAEANDCFVLGQLSPLTTAPFWRTTT